MSDGNRSWLGKAGLGLAAVCSIAVGGGLWYSAEIDQAAYQSAAERNAGQQANATSERVNLECAISRTPVAECDERIQQETYEAQQDTRDLEAQQGMAVWTRTMGIAAVIGMAVGILGLGLIFFTFRETRRAANAGYEANRIASDTSKRQLRAYVMAEDHKIYGLFRGGPAVMQVKVFNRGQTPAHDVRIWSIVTGTLDDPDYAKVKFVDDGNFKQSRDVLGPGQWTIHENGCQGPFKDEAYVTVASGGLAMVFAGVITYRDVFGKRRFTTFKQFHKRNNFKETEFDLSACGRGNRAT